MNRSPACTVGRTTGADCDDVDGYDGAVPCWSPRPWPPGFPGFPGFPDCSVPPGVVVGVLVGVCRVGAVVVDVGVGAVVSGAVVAGDGVGAGEASAAAGVSDAGAVFEGALDVGAAGAAASVVVSVGADVVVDVGLDVVVDVVDGAVVVTAVAGRMPNAVVTRTVPVATVMSAAVRQLGRCCIGWDSSTCVPVVVTIGTSRRVRPVHGA
ncbi:hypothetical protein ACRQ4B_06335 [Curtobacterium sp. SP.BCo]|uniref:hypothetical protein n=1 Tax=Curtobacterium sp. SP.BCo TaxID=3435229 RepID=UPI003F73E491